MPTLDQYKTLAAFYGYKYVLDTVPPKATDTIEGWKCLANGHLIKLSYNNLQRRGQKCVQCAKVHVVKTIQNYCKAAESHGGKYIIDTIPQRTSQPTDGWECIEKHRWSDSYNNIVNNNSWCPDCVGNSVNTIEQYTDLGLEFNLRCEIDEAPDNNDINVKWLCNEHEIVWLGSYKQLFQRKNSPCDQCNSEELNEVKTSESLNLLIDSDEIRINQGKVECLDFKLLQTPIFDSLLNTNNLTICEFMKELDIPMEFFRIDEYWDGWKYPNKFIIIDRLMLNWLGYGGKFKNQKQYALQIFRNNFLDNVDYIYDGVLETDRVIGPQRQSKREKLLAITYPCLLRWSMMIQTSGRDKIRRETFRREMLFQMYSNYQNINTSDKLADFLLVKNIVSQEKDRGILQTETERFESNVDNDNKEVVQMKLKLSTGEYCFIPMRKDGFTDVTILCKTVNKRLTNWKANSESWALIEQCSSLTGIPASQLFQVVRVGKTQHVYAHPDVAIQIAQWCSHSFSIQVSRWIRELLLTGQVRLWNEKSAEELDSIWKEKYYQSELKIDWQKQIIGIKDGKIDSLKRSIAMYEKRHKYVKFDIDLASYYAFSYGRRCHIDCILKLLIKHGIAIKDKKGSAPLDKRLKTHRTTFKWLQLELIIVAPPECIEALETAMEVRFGENLNPNSSEVFENVPIAKLKSTAISMMELLCPEKYQVISQDIIDSYNQDVDTVIKNGIEPEEDDDDPIEQKNDDDDPIEQKNDDDEDPIEQKNENPTEQKNDDTKTSSPISCTNSINAQNVNIDQTTNNITNNIQVDLTELIELLKDFKSLTIKRLDQYLEKYQLAKHGNKEKKIEKLRDYIESKAA